MITVEKSDPFSSESHRLVEVLSAELAAITGDNGKSNFTVEAMNKYYALSNWEEYQTDFPELDSKTYKEMGWE